MTSSITKCAIFSGWMEPGAETMVNFIGSNTTSEEFHSKWKKEHPEYRLHYGARDGWNALIKAAEYDNILLLKYIFSTGGPVLLELGCKTTPLIWAVINNSYKSARTLLGFGACVNVATEDGITALSCVSQTQNIALAALLLSYGATDDPALNKESDGLIEHGKKIAAEKNELFNVVNALLIEILPKCAQCIAEYADIQASEMGMLAHLIDYATDGAMKLDQNEVVAEYLAYSEEMS